MCHLRTRWTCVLQSMLSGVTQKRLSRKGCPWHRQRGWVVKVKGEGENGRIWRIRCSTFYFLLRGWLRVRCCFSWKGICFQLFAPFFDHSIWSNSSDVWSCPKGSFLRDYADCRSIPGWKAHPSILFLFRPRKDSAVAAKRQFAALHYSSWEHSSKCCNGTAAPRL